MKNILIDILRSRLFQMGAIVCLLLTGGVYFYTQWDLARYEASFVKQPQLSQSSTTVVDRDKGNSEDGENAASKPPENLQSIGMPKDSDGAVSLPQPFPPEPQPLPPEELARAIAEAEAAFAKEQEQKRVEQAATFRQFILHEYPEYRQLLKGLDENHKATVEIPSDADDTHGNIQDTPNISKERIQNAMQLLKQYGSAIALRRLYATDPALAKEIEKRLAANTLQ